MKHHSDNQSYQRNSCQQIFNYIGKGELGGKASGLVKIQSLLESQLSSQSEEIRVSIPRMTVIRSEIFSDFMRQNNLYSLALESNNDAYIAHAFQKASLPPAILGDLRDLISKSHEPLAVRSSSLLEDSSREPFAGVYATKMLPNNQPDVESRFHKLSEAIKFIYSSLFFNDSKDYFQITGKDIKTEKMAVIIQNVVGNRYADHFYPLISGVARSYNYYPPQNAHSSDGVVNLALGLGKTIVDGGTSWIYSPKSPQSPPPYNSFKELLDNSQRQFWSVKMGKIAQFNPVSEIEFMQHHDLDKAESDGNLSLLCSTYDHQNDRLVAGINQPGARLVNFSPILKYNKIPLNKLIKKLLDICQQEYQEDVEIEFAVEKDEKGFHLGFLQVRSMQVSAAAEKVDISEWDPSKLLASSNIILGNGSRNDIRDIVYVKPENFDPAHSREIAQEIREINRKLSSRSRPYLLIGFGRWGSSDPWLGIPASWSMISGARAIIEATLPNMKPDLSQGSHFFHNLIAFGVFYLSILEDRKKNIDWQWLKSQPVEEETKFVKHICCSTALDIKMDSVNKQGVIIK